MTKAPQTQKEHKTSLFIHCYLVYIAFMPLMKTLRLPHLGEKLQVSELIFIFLFISFLVELYKKGFFTLQWIFIVIFGIHLGLMVLSVLVSGNYLSGFLEVLVQAYLFLVFLISLFFAKIYKEKLGKVFYVWGLSAVIVILIGVFGLILFYLGFDERNPFVGGYGYNLPMGHYPRLMSTFRHGGYLSLYLGPSFFILLHPSFRQIRFMNRNRFAFLIGIFILVNLLTLSRNFFSWFFVLVIWWAFFRSKEERILKATIGAGICILVILGIAFSTVWNIFPIDITHSPETEEMKINFSTLPSPRLKMWQATMNTFRENPLLGKGPGFSPTGPIVIAGRYFPEGTDAHNSYLEILGTRGILGLVSFLIVPALVVLAFIRAFLKGALNLEAKLLFCALCSLIFISFIDNLEDVRHSYVILGLLAGTLGDLKSKAHNL